MFVILSEARSAKSKDPERRHATAAARTFSAELAGSSPFA